MNTHETYVSLEVAKLLKQAGFDWSEDRKYCYWEDLNCEGDPKSWFVDDLYIYEYNHPRFNGGNWVYYYRVPLHIAQKWLREVKGIEVNVLCVYIGNDKKYSYDVFEGKYNHELIKEGFDTYEEAQEAGIKKVLEIILEKGK